MMIEINNKVVNEYHVEKILSGTNLFIRFSDSMIPAKGQKGQLIDCSLEFRCDYEDVSYKISDIGQTEEKAFNKALNRLLHRIDEDQKSLQEMVDDFKKDHSFISDDSKSNNDKMPDSGVSHEYKLKNDYTFIATYTLDEDNKELPVLCQVKLLVFDHTLIDEKHWDKTKPAALVNLVLDKLQKQYPTYKLQLIDGFACAFADLTQADDSYARWY